MVNFECRLPNRIDKSSHSEIIIVIKQGNFPLRTYHRKHLYAIVSPVTNYKFIIVEESNAHWAIELSQILAFRTE